MEHVVAKEDEHDWNIFVLSRIMFNVPDLPEEETGWNGARPPWMSLEKLLWPVVVNLDGNPMDLEHFRGFFGAA